MSTKTTKYSMDMCHGALLKKIFVFSLPLFCTALLQLLFHATDLIVVGRFAGAQAESAMAAIGAVGALVQLILSLVMGLSVGANVLAANSFGASDIRRLRNVTHTAMLISIIGGIVVGIVASIFTKSLLRMMDTPDDIIDKAALYMWIYFAGLIFTMVNNFGGSIMRAIGDSRRPMYYLTIAGLANVVLNLIFVRCFNMNVGGVASATLIANALSAAMIWRALAKSNDLCRLRFRKLRIHPVVFRNMLLIGIPAGLQTSCFSLSNVLIQSSINSFGTTAIAGNTAASSLEGILYTGSYTYHQTAISFTAQNEGGGYRGRTIKSVIYCAIMALVLTTAMGVLFYIFGTSLVAIYNPKLDIGGINFALGRMKFVATTYGLCGIMDVISGSLRGIGKSIISACITLGSICLLRALWVFFVFPYHRSVDILMLSYPASWLITSIIAGAALVHFLKKWNPQTACR